jgi:hypothetical protein
MIARRSARQLRNATPSPTTMLAMHAVSSVLNVADECSAAACAASSRYFSSAPWLAFIAEYSPIR